MKTWIPDARNFAYLNWKQVDALPRESTLLVLPTAAIEQHGHHLPLATDTLINNLLLGHALRKLPADMPVYALPPVHYGKSNEHIGFPGTLSVSASTFMAVLRDLGNEHRFIFIEKWESEDAHGAALGSLPPGSIDPVNAAADGPPDGSYYDYVKTV